MFTVEDMLDGDLTDWITYVETDASYSIPGDYTITMEVRNSFGDTVSYDFPIHIVEEDSLTAVSYTHLDVYKRQGFTNLTLCAGGAAPIYRKRGHRYWPGFPHKGGQAHQQDLSLIHILRMLFKAVVLGQFWRISF